MRTAGVLCMMEKVDCIVVGAGAVGLAVARALAEAGHEVLILESASRIGSGISARNSEVIHAGMYYPPGSLKARLCVRGNSLLRAYLADRGIACDMMGKLIVATSEEETAMVAALRDKGVANGVQDLRLLSGDEAMTLEPELSCHAALFSPATGIFDTHGYMLALLADAEASGAVLALKSPVLDGRVSSGGIEVRVGGEDSMTLQARLVVNAAGLGAVALASAIVGVPRDSVPGAYLCKGSYFLLSGRRPFSHLVYPVPDPAGLGTHFTLDLAGQGRFGPDVQWIETEAYDVSPEREACFAAAIRRYWPGLPDGALRPGYAGVRPKIHPPGEAARDFLIQFPAEHGVPGLVNLFGIESPGLTASLAIADYVVEIVGA